MNWTKIAQALKNFIVAFSINPALANPPKQPGPAPLAPRPTQPTPAPVTPPTEAPSVPQTPKKDMLTTFCTAIMHFEGGPGDPNHINNNPGDFRCSPMGYLPKYGNVRCSANNFAIFPTFELGWEYLVASVHYRAVAHPNWTILDFFQGIRQPDGTYEGGYAPSSDDNNPNHYAEVVANECGVVATTTLKELFA